MQIRKSFSFSAMAIAVCALSSGMSAAKAAGDGLLNHLFGSQSSCSTSCGSCESSVMPIVSTPMEQPVCEGAVVDSSDCNSGNSGCGSSQIVPSEYVLSGMSFDLNVAMTGQIKELTAKVETLEADKVAAAKESEAKITELETKLAEAAKQSAAVEQQLADLKKANEALAAEKTELAAKVDEQAKSQADQVAQTKKAQEQLAETEKQLAEAKSEVDALRKEKQERLTATEQQPADTSKKPEVEGDETESATPDDEPPVEVDNEAPPAPSGDSNKAAVDA